MGIERVTPWPGVYAGEPETWEIPRLEAEADALWKIRAKDKFYLVLPIAMRKGPSSVRLTTIGRRRAVQVVAGVTKDKAVFNKQTDSYQIGGWNVGAWTTVSPLFSVEGREKILPVLDALAQAGFELDESVELCWMPPEEDRCSAFSISELTDHEGGFLRQLLQLKADPRCIINQDTYDFDIAMDRLSSEAMGRVLLVVRRMILYAMEETGKGSAVAIS